jgi:hypothetical protein
MGVVCDRLHGMLRSLLKVCVSLPVTGLVVGCACALIFSVAGTGLALASQARLAGSTSSSSATPPFVLACPSASSCVAADHIGNIIQWTGLSGATAPVSSVQSVDSGNAITGIACPRCAWPWMTLAMC